MEFQESNLLFNDLCRLCLVNPGAAPINEKLKQNVFACTGVEVSISDNLPSKICMTCYEIVHKAIDFREAVSKNDTLLKSLFENEEIIEYQVVIKDENEDYEMATENYIEDTQIDESLNSTENYTYSCIINLTSSTPLGTLTIRKDLFPTSEQEIQQEKIDCTNNNKQRIKDRDIIEVKSEEIVENENNCEEKVETKAKYEGKNVYKCEECCKIFSTRKKLYHHMRQHTKNKPCPIKECGKMFCSKSDLEKHIRVHTGIKPYKCNLCDKSFTQNSSLRGHKDAVH